MSQILEQSKQPIFLVVDDNEAIVAGTSQALKRRYPQVEVLTALDAQTAQSQVERYYLDVENYYLDLVVLDLSLPDKPYSTANSEVGIQLLKTLMEAHPAPNIAVLSTNIKSLVRVKPLINSYEGGFVAMDKSIPNQEMLKLVDFALRGSIYLPPQVRSRPEIDRKWIEMLTLKFEQALTDQAIAKRMSVSDRTIRNYWLRLQDALGIHDDPEKDLKIQIEIVARKIGLLG